MKKSWILFFSSLLFLGSCSNEEEVYQTSDVWAKGFKSLSPQANREGCSTLFVFFRTDGSPNFLVSEKRASDIKEFEEAKDEICDLLLDGSIKLEDGSIKHADFTVWVDADSKAYKEIDIPKGRYYVCAVSKDYSYGVRSRYSLKYCAKYIDVKDRMAALQLSPTFPYDYSRYGLIPWTDWSEPFTYSW